MLDFIPKFKWIFPVRFLGLLSFDGTKWIIFFAKYISLRYSEWGKFFVESCYCYKVSKQVIHTCVTSLNFFHYRKWIFTSPEMETINQRREWVFKGHKFSFDIFHVFFIFCKEIFLIKNKQFKIEFEQENFVLKLVPSHYWI